MPYTTPYLFYLLGLVLVGPAQRYWREFLKFSNALKSADLRIEATRSPYPRHSSRVVSLRRQQHAGFRKMSMQRRPKVCYFAFHRLKCHLNERLRFIQNSSHSNRRGIRTGSEKPFRAFCVHTRRQLECAPLGHRRMARIEKALLFGRPNNSAPPGDRQNFLHEKS